MLLDLTTAQTFAVILALAVGIGAGAWLWWKESPQRAQYAETEARNAARARAKKIQADIRLRMMGRA